MSQSPPILSNFRIFAEQQPGKIASITGLAIDWDEVPDGEVIAEPLQLKSIQGNVATLLVQPNDDRFNGHGMAVEYPIILGAAADDNALQWAQYIGQNPEHVSPFFAMTQKSEFLDLSKFKGVVEDWKPMKKSNGAPGISGTLIGHESSLTPFIIEESSAIIAKDGQHVITASGSRYAIGTPQEGVRPDLKARLLAALPQVVAETADNDKGFDPDFLNQQLG